ncbi:MAG: 6-carboxytetrahydropterin synthase [Candidatus Omnitrophica bacterium]|nr:6-carboxytetrahydropterin synthase [Candidatus Omnitrophota bacterium]
MYEIKVIEEFSAAHNLRGYKGKCENLHGHNWKIEAVFVRKDLNKLGMVADFKKARGKLTRLLKNLDHKHLNNRAYFRKFNPTSENIARYIFGKLSYDSKAMSCKLRKITVWESSNSCATYYE